MACRRLNLDAEFFRTIRIPRTFRQLNVETWLVREWPVLESYKQTSPPLKIDSLIKRLLMNMTREINLERALPRKKTKRPRDLGNDNLSFLANQHESKQA